MQVSDSYLNMLTAGYFGSGRFIDILKTNKDMIDRFFINQHNLKGQMVILNGQQAHQIRNVLRKKPGEHIIVLDNTGQEYQVELKKVTRDIITGQIKQKRWATGEPSVEITLYQGLLAREKFEWVLQKCTEVGVTQFVPIVTERTVVQDLSIKSDKIQRWQRIITEAAEQSTRGKIPVLNKAIKFDEAIAELDEFDCKLLAWEQEQNNNLQNSLTDPNKGKIKSVALFIGPEGGFTEKEVKYAQEHLVEVITLGKRILRTETAAIVTTGLILYELGEIGR